MDIFQALEMASSQDPDRAQAGLKSIQDIQKRQGAFADMLSIGSNRAAPPDVRRIAIIHFKNTAINQWRNRQLFTPEHRVAIRLGLLTFFDDPDDTIAQCSAVIIAKIFRIESTREWPQLLPALASVIQTNADKRFMSPAPPPEVSLMLRRSLYTLNQLIKEIGGTRLPSGIQLTAQIVKETHPFLTEKYARFAAHLAASLNPSTVATTQTAWDVQITHLLYKCLSKNIIWLWTRPKSIDIDDTMQISTFFSSSASQYQTWFDLRMTLLLALKTQPLPIPPVALITIDQLTRHVLAFGKFFRRLQQPAIPKFIALPGCSDLVLYCWRQVVQANSGAPNDISDGFDAVYPTRALLQGMVLFKDCLGQWTPVKQANLDRGNPLLNQDFVTEAVTLIITRFLPLKPADLEKWEVDPEEWVLEETKDYEAWEFDIRICAERVLMTLIDKYQHFVVPILLATLDSELNAVPSANLESVLRREAVYFSIGGHFNRLRTSIDLHQLVAKFTVDIPNPSPTYRILKRRIGWVLGKSAPEEELAPGMEPAAKIWELLSILLQDQSESSDVAVRLSAALAIRERVDCLSFDADTLNPCLASLVGGLMQLISEVDSLESKTQITKTLNAVIEANAVRIIPFMDIITVPVPKLWAGAANDYIFKAALLDTVRQLVEASQEQSSTLHHIVVPIIQESLKPQVITHLDQDGLELWLSALRNATSHCTAPPGVPSLLDLAPAALHLLAENLDLLGTVVSIVEAYFLLDAPGLLQRYALELHQAILRCLHQAIASNAKELLVSMETMILKAPAALWARPMFDSGLFKHILDTINAGKGSADTNNAYLHVLARIIYSEAGTFFQMLSAIPAIDHSKTLDKLLDQWWRQFDSMSEPRHRKLTAMAMASIVATGRPEVLKRLSGETFNLWLDVLGEMKEALKSSDYENHLILYWRESGTQVPESLLKGSEGSLEESRRRELYRSDPINSTMLTTYIRLKLEEGRQNCPGGPAAFDAHMQKADELVVKQLLEAIAPTP